MKVSMNTVVTIDFELTDSDGKTLEKSKEPISYLHGGFDNIFPKIEEAIHGKAQGDEVEVSTKVRGRGRSCSPWAEVGTVRWLILYAGSSTQ